MIEEIIAIPIDDGIAFSIKSISEIMQGLWKSYQKKFSYAEDITWKMVMDSIKKLLAEAKLTDSVFTASALYKDGNANEKKKNTVVQ